MLNWYMRKVGIQIQHTFNIILVSEFLLTFKKKYGYTQGGFYYHGLIFLAHQFVLHSVIVCSLNMQMEIFYKWFVGLRCCGVCWDHGANSRSNWGIGCLVSQSIIYGYHGDCWSPILNTCRCMGDLFSTFGGAQNILLHPLTNGQSKEENMFLWFMAIFCGGICMLNMVFFRLQWNAQPMAKVLVLTSNKVTLVIINPLIFAWQVIHAS